MPTECELSVEFQFAAHRFHALRNSRGLHCKLSKTYSKSLHTEKFLATSLQCGSTLGTRCGTREEEFRQRLGATGACSLSADRSPIERWIIDSWKASGDFEIFSHKQGKHEWQREQANRTENARWKFYQRKSTRESWSQFSIERTFESSVWDLPPDRSVNRPVSVAVRWCSKVVNICYA